MYTILSTFGRLAQLTVAIMFGFLLGIGAQTVLAWTAPPTTPPGGNVPGPVTTGGSQVKTGGLDLGSLIVQGGAELRGSLNVTGATDSGSLTVQGVSTLNSTLTVLGLASLASLNVTGATNSGSLTVQGDSILKADVGIGIDTPTGSGGITSSAKTGSVFSPDRFLDVHKPGWAFYDDVQIHVGDLVLNSRQGGSSNVEAVNDRGSNGNLVLGAENDVVINTQTAGTDVYEMYIKNNGNVGIGTDAPATKLDVNGNVRATAFLYSSDERLKHDIFAITDPLTKLRQLRGVSFVRNENDMSDVGVIAQEVEKVLPQAVHTNPDTGYKSVDYAKIVPLLVEAINTQQKEIELLKSRVSGE